MSFLVAIVFLWLAVFSYGAVWNRRRKRRAHDNIRAALQQAGYEVVNMSYRYWRTGPFSVWNTSRLHFVFRVLVRRAPGGERSVWARWGRPWFTSPDTLELHWDTP